MRRDVDSQTTRATQIDCHRRWTCSERELSVARIRRAIQGHLDRRGHLVSDARLADSLYVRGVIPVRDRIAAKIQGIRAGGGLPERHQVFAVRADVGHVMIDSVFVSFDAPLQRVAGYRCGDAEAIADARLNLGSFFVVVPGDQLHGLELLPGVVQTVCVRKGLQPGLSALLSHNAVRAPRRERVVETFVSGADGLFVRQRHARLIKARQITHPVVGCSRHDPRIAAITQNMRESIIVLE